MWQTWQNYLSCCQCFDTVNKLSRCRPLLIEVAGHLARENFHTEYAELILQMQVPLNGCDDFSAWHYESDGIFSVQSAYKLAYNIQHNAASLPRSSIAGNSSKATWKTIWSAPVPNQVEVFQWRAAKDNIATEKAKFKRNLELDSVSLCLRVEMRKVWDILFLF
jgi:hypothetical protein